MSKQVNYNENLCAGAAIRDDKGRRISKLFEAPHPKMTVGYAKNLIMPDDPTEQEFNFRQSGGGVIEDGVAVIDKVKGNSVVWNQMVEVERTFTANGVHFEKNGNSVKVYTDTDGATVTTAFTDMLGSKKWSEVAIVGHKYSMSGCPNGGNRDSFYMSCYSSNSWQGEKFDTGNGVVFSVTESVSNGYPRIEVTKGTIITTPIYFRPQLVDLTQMFGAGNEPSTYEEFLQRKPKVADEYAYNEGTIVNNKVEKVVTTGKNLWDEEWELGTYRNDNGEKYNELTRIRSKNPIACTPSTTYYAFYGNGNDELYVYFYDENMGYITSSPYRVDNRTFTSPSNARFFTLGTFGAVTTTYNHDICINVSDPTINGQYFPYEKHELDLSWVKEIKDTEGVKLFDDGMRSAGTAFDEVRKNKAVKRIGVVDLGDIDWGRYNFGTEDEPHFRFYSLRPLASMRPLTIVLTAKYKTVISAGDIDAEDKTISGQLNQNYLYIHDDSYTDEASFKAAMSGVMLYYELAEPIEVEYDEKNLTYPVVAGGTEEAIASEPSTAFRADIGYGIDAVKTILDLKARVEALEAK